MLTKAVARYIRLSPRKARLVADLVRGKTVAEALAILQYSPQIAARQIEGAAVGHRQRRAQPPGAELDVQVHAVIDGGPSLKRIQPRAMGRAFWIRHRLATSPWAWPRRGGSRAGPATCARGGAQAPGRWPPGEHTGEGTQEDACEDDEERLMGQKVHRSDSGWARRGLGARAGSPPRSTRTCSTRTPRSGGTSRMRSTMPASRRSTSSARPTARIIVHTARPGIIIGRKGAEVEKLKNELQTRTGKEIHLDIQVVHPELDSQLVAENIALQLEKRVAFRRAMKKAVQSSVRLGAEGFGSPVQDGLAAPRSRAARWYRDGRVPLQTLRADLDFGIAARTRRTAPSA